MRSILTIFLIFVLASCTNSGNEEERVAKKIEHALNILKDKDYQEAWVVITAEPSGKFIQFFSSNHKIYFDFPVKAEVKNKYVHSNEGFRVDSIGDSTTMITLMSETEISRLKELLKRFELKYSFYRQGFIDPAQFNMTDTTGWVTSITGEFNLESKYLKEFIDKYFEKVYSLDVNAIKYKIEEN